MIDREKVIEALHCRGYDDDLPCSVCAYWRPDEKPVARCDYKQMYDDAIALLKEQPEIIRCKDCKHATMTTDGKLCKYCEIDTDDFGDQREVYHDADWYCADGEMREMTDREKVIGHLNDCMEASRRDNTWVFVRKDIVEDAIALLKEQEAVKPIAKEDDTYECICGAIVGWDELDASGIVQTRFNYCPFCGKPVLWKGR